MDSLKRKINENQEKIIREKISKIEKDYPTISGKDDTKNDPRFVRNIFTHIWLLLKCEKKRLNEVSRLNDLIEKEFGKSMNIFNFIKRSKKLQVVEDILFDTNEKHL